MREPFKIDFHCATFTHVVNGCDSKNHKRFFIETGREKVSSRILIAFNKSLLFEDINIIVVINSSKGLAEV